MECTQVPVLSSMQKDIRELRVSNTQIREKLFDGVSSAAEEIPRLSKKVERIEVKIDSIANSQGQGVGWKKHAWRLVGTILIALFAGIGIAAVFLLVVKAAPSDQVAEFIGLIIASVLGK